MNRNPDTIYGLLPGLYTRLDAMTGGPLAALSGVLEEARAQIADDIAGLYDDWFVATCQPAILPYLAGLTGAPMPGTADNPRAAVADRIALARRKGTAIALERAITDLTGWPAQVLTGAAPGKAIVKLWPDPVQRLTGVAPRAASASDADDPPHRFRLHPLGVDCQLVVAVGGARPIDTLFVAEFDAPLPLTHHSSPALVARNLALHWIDTDKAMIALPAERIGIADLGDWGDEQRAVLGHAVLVDPARGRMVVLDDALAGGQWRVDFACVGPGQIGAGRAALMPELPPPGAWIARVGGDTDGRCAADGTALGSGTAAFATLADAINAFRAIPGDGLILICDSATHPLHRQIITDRCEICPTDPASPRRLMIAAAPGETPALVGDWRTRGHRRGLVLGLHGLTIDGQITVHGAVGLTMTHCSVQPVAAMRVDRVARAAVRLVAGHGKAPDLTLSFCLTGAVLAQGECALRVADSVIDGYGCLPAIKTAGMLTIDRATALGDVVVAALAARDCLFAAPVRAADPDHARAAHCALPAGSDVGELDACDVYRFAPEPHLRAMVPGAPGYARLRRDAPLAWRQGASDDGEVGAFHSARLPARHDPLAEVLREYVPLGTDISVEWVFGGDTVGPD